MTQSERSKSKSQGNPVVSALMDLYHQQAAEIQRLLAEEEAAATAYKTRRVALNQAAPNTGIPFLCSIDDLSTSTWSSSARTTPQSTSMSPESRNGSQLADLSQFENNDMSPESIVDRILKLSDDDIAHSLNTTVVQARTLMPLRTDFRDLLLLNSVEIEERLAIETNCEVGLATLASRLQENLSFAAVRETVALHYYDQHEVHRSQLLLEARVVIGALQKQLGVLENSRRNGRSKTHH